MHLTINEHTVTKKDLNLYNHGTPNLHCVLCPLFCTQYGLNMAQYGLKFYNKNLPHIFQFFLLRNSSDQILPAM